MDAEAARGLQNDQLRLANAGPKSGRCSGRVKVAARQGCFAGGQAVGRRELLCDHHYSKAIVHSGILCSWRLWGRVRCESLSMQEELGTPIPEEKNPDAQGKGRALPDYGLDSLTDPPAESKGDSKKSSADWFARSASLFSVLLTLVSIYLTLLRPSHLESDLGNRIFLQGHARLMMACLFTNTGAKEAVVRSAQAVCDGGRVFDWNMVASHVSEWEYTDKGPVIQSFKYSIAFPFAVKKDDQYMSVLVFTAATPNGRAAFSAGQHSCQVRFEAQGQTIEKTTEFSLTPEDVESLTKFPTSELPIAAHSPAAQP